MPNQHSFLIPRGRIERAIEDAHRGLYVRWAPGTGFVFQLVVTRPPENVAGYTGGKTLLTIELNGRWVSMFVTITGLGLIHQSMIEEHFVTRKVPKRDVLLYTALLNWVLFPSHPTTLEYALDCYNEAMGVRNG